MSIHSSLRGVDTLTGERSVLTRIERIQKLRKEGRFDPESAEASAYRLPKVRTKFKVVSAKKRKAAEAEAKKGGESEGKKK